MELLSFALYHEGDEQHGRLPPSNPSSLPPTAEEEEEQEEEEEDEEGGKENKSSSNRRRRRRGGRKSGGSEATDEEEDEEEEGSEGGSPLKKGGGKKARISQGGDVRGDLFLSRLNAALQVHGDGLPFNQFVELLNEGLEEGGREGGLFTEEEAMRLVVAQDENGKCYWEENAQVIYSS